MKIQIETPAYDHTQFGQPWVAKVSFTDPSGSFEWGRIISGAPGEEGLLVIEASHNDIVARGQKDLAAGKTIPAFYRVTDAGELERLPSRAAAYKLWQQNNQQTPTP
jgi:hypothetical protein